MSILKNLNYIKQMNTIPCGQPDWFIIIETAFTSAPPALLTLFTPGCTDIVKTRLGHSPWHHRGVKALLKGVISPQVIGANKFLYKIGYFTAEKYLWWFMVADVTTEFVTTWQSQVFQMQQCQLPGAGTASGQFPPFFYQEGGERALNIGYTYHQPGILAAGQTLAVIPGFQANVGWSIQWDSWPVRGQGANVSTWYTVEDDTTPLSYSNTGDQGAGMQGVTAGHFYHNVVGGILPTRYKFWCEVQGPGLVQPTGGSWSASLFGHRAGNLSWGCNPKPAEWPFPNPLSYE
jgi:hypothetical protein